MGDESRFRNLGVDVTSDGGMIILGCADGTVRMLRNSNLKGGANTPSNNGGKKGGKGK